MQNRNATSVLEVVQRLDTRSGKRTFHGLASVPEELAHPGRYHVESGDGCRTAPDLVVAGPGLGLPLRFWVAMLQSGE